MDVGKDLVKGNVVMDHHVLVASNDIDMVDTKEGVVDVFYEASGNDDAMVLAIWVGKNVAIEVARNNCLPSMSWSLICNCNLWS